MSTYLLTNTLLLLDFEVVGSMQKVIVNNRAAHPIFKTPLELGSIFSQRQINNLKNALKYLHYVSFKLLSKKLPICNNQRCDVQALKRDLEVHGDTLFPCQFYVTDLIGPK